MEHKNGACVTWLIRRWSGWLFNYKSKPQMSGLNSDIQVVRTKSRTPEPGFGRVLCSVFCSDHLSFKQISLRSRMQPISDAEQHWNYFSS